MINLIFLGKKRKAEAERLDFDICLKDGTVVGECNLRIGGDTFFAGNVGYRIKEEFRNRGYAYAAVLALMKTAEKEGLSELVICCDPSNLPSRRVAEKLGAVYLGDATVPNTHELYAYGRRAVSRFSLRLAR